MGFLTDLLGAYILGGVIGYAIREQNDMANEAAFVRDAMMAEPERFQVLIDRYTVRGKTNLAKIMRDPEFDAILRDVRAKNTVDTSRSKE